MLSGSIHPRRVAVGGFQHETNSFAPLPADLAAFETGALVRGGAMSRLAGSDTPTAGFTAASEAAGVEVAPLLFAWAGPSGPVTAEAYTAITSELLERLAAAGPVDGLFLDLHGAMIAEGALDGEGELLRRVRAQLGPDLPVVVALDFHANVSEAMVELADGLVGYRTYPHVDSAQTGRRAFALLQRRWAHGRPAARALRRGAYLTPTVAQSTELEPMRGLQRLGAKLADEDAAIWSADLLAGFPLADTPCAGATAIAYADTSAAAEAAAERLIAAYAEAEPAFAAPLWSPGDAVAEARRLLALPGSGPVVMADTQDNPGGGGTGDTVGLLRALLDAGVERAALGLLVDPAAAEAAHAAGVGARLAVSLGAKRGGADEAPVEGEAEVVGLSDGNGVHRGPFLRNAAFRLGPTAALRLGGATVVVSTYNVQCADREMFRIVGIDPDALDVVALKSSVHFRADFAPTARAILVVLAPGPCLRDHRRLAYSRLPTGMRVMPTPLPEGEV